MLCVSIYVYVFFCSEYGTIHSALRTLYYSELLPLVGFCFIYLWVGSCDEQHNTRSPKYQVHWPDNTHINLLLFACLIFSTLQLMPLYTGILLIDINADVQLQTEDGHTGLILAGAHTLNTPPDMPNQGRSCLY
jgi:hypothetical protein